MRNVFQTTPLYFCDQSQGSVPATIGEPMAAMTAGTIVHERTL